MGSPLGNMPLEVHNSVCMDKDTSGVNLTKGKGTMNTRNEFKVYHVP